MKYFKAFETYNEGDYTDRYEYREFRSWLEQNKIEYEQYNQRYSYFEVTVGTLKWNIDIQNNGCEVRLDYNSEPVEVIVKNEGDLQKMLLQAKEIDNVRKCLLIFFLFIEYNVEQITLEILPGDYYIEEASFYFFPRSIKMPNIWYSQLSWNISSINGLEEVEIEDENELLLQLCDMIEIPLFLQKELKSFFDNNIEKPLKDQISLLTKIDKAALKNTFRGATKMKKFGF